MAVKHNFVSPKADGGDTTLVRPSNWNADHEGSPDFLQLAQVATSINLTLDDTHSTVKATGGAGGITITLPTAVGRQGRRYTIVRVDVGAGDVTLDGNGSETINGDADYILVNQWQHVTVESDNVNWVVVGSN